ncbi:mfs-type transporter slc18b1-like protein [Holotrichia oblita]|uniref:Mfs-type transporter slc18b1-like protein n=1 Tax=Holotrichia oblita TaxID=644536 RepID=A0ACB9TC64_HOLOL|nr:mfs-type transporter slc18b1-like protein [Holotrichia oblita]
MAPFYPREAQLKGMSETLAGLVFSFYAMVVFVSSPIFGKLLPRFGVKITFIFGIIISGICSIMFGSLQFVNDSTAFTVLSFVIRGTEALGASAYSTAGYVLIINIFPKNGGVVRGILETFVGLGMSVGPAIGGLLFAVRNKTNYVMCTIVLKTYYYKLEVKAGSFRNILKLPSVIITCLVVIVVSATWGFLDPTLEPHLRKFNLSAGNMGLIFLLLSAMYGIFSPVWGFISDKITNYWYLMSLGLFFNSFSLLFLGPSPVLPFLEQNGGFCDNLGTHSVVAGLWSSAYSLGEMLGPAIGGVMLQHWGFPKASTAIAGFNFLFAFVSGIYFFARTNKRRNL